MDFITRVIEDEQRKMTEFEARIFDECDLCKKAILYGDSYYKNDYEVFICKSCMDGFEERQA